MRTVTTVRAFCLLRDSGSQMVMTLCALVTSLYWRTIDNLLLCFQITANSQGNKLESMELLPTLLSTSADKLSQRLLR